MEEVRPLGPAGPGDVIGRRADLDVLHSFLAHGAERGGALLLTGGAGVGKSLLLGQACQEAERSGSRLLRAGGVQFEAEVSFAGLNQLLLPLRDESAALPGLHRDALSVALGEGSGSAGDGLVISAAVLGLLRHASRQRPLAVAVDDLQWLDRASARVLGFVARRLDGCRVAFLAAVRSESDSFLLDAGLPRHEVRPLDEVSARLLLDSRFPGLAAPVRRPVLAAAQGNPLALLELPASMSEAQRRADEPLPAVLSLSGQLQDLFADRVRRLPPVTRRLLLLIALEGTGDLRLLRGASADEDWLDGLAPAEQDGLLRVDLGARRAVLRHPLIGAAAVELATGGDRRRAHADLAELLADEPERRAWHLAEAVVGPDESAAGELELSAHRALHKGDAVRAVQAMLRAADLSPHGTDRARRLAAAAYVGADVAGQLSSVPRLLGEARRAAPGTDESLEVTVAAAHHLLNGEGDVATAHLMLTRAVEHALERRHAGRAVHEALHSLLLVCHFSGGDEPWRPFDAALTRLGARASPVLSISASTCGDPARVTSEVLDRLDELLAGLESEVDPAVIVRAGIASFHVDRLVACRSSLRRVVSDGRDGGAAASAVNALMMLAYDAFLDGRWDEALRTAEEGVAWGERLGYQLIALPGVYCLALLAAARGESDETRLLTDELVDWGAPRGVRMFEHFAHRANGLLALGRGDYEEAFQRFASISPPGRLAPHVPVALWVAPDLVEAAVRTGRSAEADAHVAAMRRTEISRYSPRLGLMTAGAAAVAATGPAAGDLYREALGVPGAERFPFERARVQLTYGEHLRRARAVQAARTELLSALGTFRRLRAKPWVTRTVHELRATGQRRPPPSAGADAARTLTAQEHQIASLAASGLSNKEIGARLYLSPRTVSGHLYRIFPKLGVSARAALRDALMRVPPPASSPED